MLTNLAYDYLRRNRQTLTKLTFKESTMTQTQFDYEYLLYCVLQTYLLFLIVIYNGEFIANMG